MRGAVVLAAIAAHTVLSRLLYAEADRLAAQAGGSPDEWRRAAELMWFEGDLAELALLVAFAASAHRGRPRRRPAPAAPRTGLPAPRG